ncbi:hypothetical protein CSB85_4882 [Pseudomonas aeruginosa]|nr:hypothetical protein CSB97_4544 [Pseudomonas aeruginosa]AVK29533.1 hypothetical protein CSB85_4882 [Pseudomonas aeruginosa]AWE80205.1 hypothetical protein CSC31_5702 [Pseudomonas aeruginosa]CCQ85710.1 hypothetical protein PA18A_2303 [Pseudomonas aeruginosa 18A]
MFLSVFYEEDGCPLGVAEQGKSRQRSGRCCVNRKSAWSSACWNAREAVSKPCASRAKGTQGRCCGRGWRTVGGNPPFIRHHLADSRQAC